MNTAHDLVPRTTLAGELLTKARIETGLSQRELAHRAGVAQSTVARIESGRTDPGFEMVRRILAAVGLEPLIHLRGIIAATEHSTTEHSRKEFAGLSSVNSSNGRPS